MEENKEQKDEQSTNTQGSSEDSGPRVEYDPTKINVQAEDLKKVPKSLLEFIRNVLSFKADVDVPGTIEEIRGEIEFKGHSVWVLMFSILVASIGLDANSEAVVIGAMLISPLMGPIKGVGLAVGMQDFRLLIKSLVNFGVMVGISLLVSWLYFQIIPFKEPSAEILKRTQPDFRDALIAFFGGMAGIIAATQKGKIFTVVSGVAIATALMPPLCSAGFMLANGDFPLLFNAFYLFLINSLLICLASLIVIRYLKFPVVEFVSKRTERKVKIYISIFMLLILIPSVYQFYYVMKENNFERHARAFVANEIEGYSGARLKLAEYEYMRGDTLNVIHVEFRENGFVSKEIVRDWRRKLKAYAEEHDIDPVYLDIPKQNLQEEIATLSYEDLAELQDDWRKERRELQGEIDFRDERIRLYREQLEAYEGLSVPATKRLELEIQANYPGVEGIVYLQGFGTLEGATVDSTKTVLVKWKETMTDSLINIKKDKLENWLRIRHNNENLMLINLNDGKKQEPARKPEEED